jgi:hypothetical protein
MFEKKVVVLKGMPIPAYAQGSKYIEIVGIPEISNLELNLKKHRWKSTVFGPPFFPDAEWAVQELVKISRTADAEVHHRLLFANGIFYILWSLSLVTRAVGSVYSKFTRLYLRFTLLARIPNQRQPFH